MVYDKKFRSHNKNNTKIKTSFFNCLLIRHIEVI